MCAHARELRSFNNSTWSNYSSMLSVGGLVEVGSLSFFVFWRSCHKDWARAGFKSVLGLYKRVPYFLVLQQYSIWCCKLAVKLLSMYADVTSLEITISSFRWYSNSVAKEQNKSWTLESRSTFPLRNFLPTVTTTLFVAASINSSTDFTLVGVCWAIEEIFALDHYPFECLIVWGF